MKNNVCKFMVILCSICIMTTLFSVGASAAFSDTQGHWAQSAIDKWSNLGIIQGYDGQFSPDESITRGQMAVIIDNIMKYKTKSTNNFSDLGKDFYTDAVLKANRAGVILGDSTLVRPKDNITREEAVVMLGRALGLDKLNTSKNVFSDSSNISTWAMGYVNAMSDKGYVNGANGKFNPKAPITRAETIKILNNAISMICNGEKEYTGDVTGIVIINTPNVVLKNMKIDGSLIISEGVGLGDATLNNVKINGKTVVRGGGENSIHIIGDSDIASIIIEKTDDGSIRVVTADGTIVKSVFIDDGKDDVILTGSFDSVILSAEVNVKAVGAHIQKVEVSAQKSNLTVDNKSTVKNLTIKESATKSKIEINGKVEKAEVNADGIIINGNKPSIVNIGNKVTDKPFDSNGKPIGGDSETPDNGGGAGGGGSVTPPTVPVSSIKMDQAAIKLTSQGDTGKIIATIEPSNATNKNITWTTSNQDIATVNNGVVTPLKEGKATITATTEDGKITATCEITVSARTPVVSRVSSISELNSKLSKSQSGDEIIVSDNITANESINVPQDVTVTIDEGKTLTINGALTNNGTISTKSPSAPEANVLRARAYSEISYEVDSLSTEASPLVIGSTGVLTVKAGASIDFENYNDIVTPTQNSVILYEGAKVSVGGKQYIGDSSDGALIKLTNFAGSDKPVAGYFMDGYKQYLLLVINEKAEVLKSDNNVLDIFLLVKAAINGGTAAELTIPNFDIIAPTVGSVCIESNAILNEGNNKIVSESNTESIFNATGGDEDNRRGIRFYKLQDSLTVSIRGDAKMNRAFNQAIIYPEFFPSDDFHKKSLDPTLTINFEPMAGDFIEDPWNGTTPQFGKTYKMYRQKWILDDPTVTINTKFMHEYTSQGFSVNSLVARRVGDNINFNVIYNSKTQMYTSIFDPPNATCLSVNTGIIAPGDEANLSFNIPTNKVAGIKILTIGFSADSRNYISFDASQIAGLIYAENVALDNAITKIINAGTDTMAATILENAELLCLDLTAYNGLSDKGSVIDAMVGLDKADKVTIISTFNEAVKNATKPAESDSN